MADIKDKLVFDQSPDKFVFNSLFNLISRIYQAAIKNYKQTHQQVKAANYLEQCAILSLIQKYFNVTLEPFQVQFNDDDTLFTCGPLSVVITDDNIVAHWDNGTRIEMIFDYDQVVQLLDDIYKDQTILINAAN